MKRIGLAPNVLRIWLLSRTRAWSFLGEDRRLHEVGDPQAHARRLVTVRGADAALGGADLVLALELLAPLVDQTVIGQHEVRAVADEEVAVHFHPLGAQSVDLSDQRDGIDDHAVADDADLAGTQDARRNEMEDELLVAVHDGVAGVVAALAAYDHLRGAGSARR